MQGEEGKRGEGGKSKGGEVNKSSHSREEAEQQGVEPVRLGPARPGLLGAAGRPAGWDRRRPARGWVVGRSARPTG